MTNKSAPTVAVQSWIAALVSQGKTVSEAEQLVEDSGLFRRGPGVFESFRIRSQAN